MKNKWKFITRITLMSPTIIGLLYLIIMAVIESGTFLVFVSFIGVTAASFIGAGLYVIWLEHKMKQDEGLDNPPEPPTQNYQ